MQQEPQSEQQPPKDGQEKRQYAGSEERKMKKKKGQSRKKMKGSRVARRQLTSQPGNLNIGRVGKGVYKERKAARGFKKDV